MSTALLHLCGKPSVTHRRSWLVPRDPDQARSFDRHEARGGTHRIRIREDAIAEYETQFTEDGPPPIVSGPLVEVATALSEIAKNGEARFVTVAIRERVPEVWQGRPTGFVRDECVNTGIAIARGDVYETGSLRTAVSLLNRYGLILEAVPDDESAEPTDDAPKKSRVKKR